jgi:hypothetical protein
MSNVLRMTARSKKNRMVKPEIMSREDYQGRRVNVRVELIQALIPLGIMAVHEEIQREVAQLAGGRYVTTQSEMSALCWVNTGQNAGGPGAYPGDTNSTSPGVPLTPPSQM